MSSKGSWPREQHDARRLYCCPRLADAVDTRKGEVKMSTLTAAHSGTFRIGGELEIHRLGFGAMRITGKGIWGQPADKPEALRVLKRLPELGVNFIDTADSYGPDVSEGLLREA